jgi:hypothetical protein
MLIFQANPSIENIGSRAGTALAVRLSFGKA